MQERRGAVIHKRLRHFQHAAGGRALAVAVAAAAGGVERGGGGRGGSGQASRRMRAGRQSEEQEGSQRWRQAALVTALVCAAPSTALHGLQRVWLEDRPGSQGREQRAGLQVREPASRHPFSGPDCARESAGSVQFRRSSPRANRQVRCTFRRGHQWWAARRRCSPRPQHLGVVEQRGTGWGRPMGYRGVRQHTRDRLKTGETGPVRRNACAQKVPRGRFP